ncbi:hypothetical protein E1B28_004940 [Marasmius oreades]|uniref:Uncharacterized protein n=1 Tax=Marasmius oreades TaxID=181124 RepID=A0A9P7UZR1_9AGAR|nr:uncharacterized protein E1B28_004940 [Marasmius oreades]KAG7097606.1 hypothetical protein E1B28_004940 [Marasmius oreades]
MQQITEKVDRHEKLTNKLEDEVKRLDQASKDAKKENERRKAENEELQRTIAGLTDEMHEKFDVVAAGDQLGFAYIKLRNLLFAAREEIAKILQLNQNNPDQDHLGAFHDVFCFGTKTDRIQRLQEALHTQESLHPTSRF